LVNIQKKIYYFVDTFKLVLRNEFLPYACMKNVSSLSLEAFVQDAKLMLDITPGIYWGSCQKLISPIFIMVS